MTHHLSTESAGRLLPFIKRENARGKRILFTLLLLLPAALSCAPVLFLLIGSVMSRGELTQALSPVWLDTKEFVSFKLMPDYPTFTHYKRLLFETPQFFVLFWNSVKLTGGILAGQLLVGVPAAWAFAVYPSSAASLNGGRGLFTLYVTLMLLPFQVTMLSSYLVLDGLKLMNTHGAILFPAVFSAFPVFICYGGFRQIPKELLEAARMDGAGEWKVFLTVGAPLGKSGILSSMVLGFLEYWNLMEQPMAFLQEQALWPLSLYLPQIDWTQAGYAFAASVLTLAPAVFVFLAGQEYLEKGIIYAGLKG